MRYLQLMIILIGIGTLALLLVGPRREGRNAGATNLEIYFHDPFLAYVYAASIAFFVALYYALRLLGSVKTGHVVPNTALTSIRKIKQCCYILLAFLLGAQAYFIIVQRQIEDDIAGGVMIGNVLIALSLSVVAAMTIAESLLLRALRHHL